MSKYEGMSKKKYFETLNNLQALKIYNSKEYKDKMNKEYKALTPCKWNEGNTKPYIVSKDSNK